jgi:quercetin dioxygenase-like cupin family protein
MKIEPIRHVKGWGYEDWLVNTDLYCGKILYVLAGKKCSLHFHKLKTETMLVVDGRVLFEFREEGEETLSSLTLVAGDVFHISPGLLHRFTAITNSTIHEFSTEHFEDDSYRVEYGD